MRDYKKINDSIGALVISRENSLKIGTISDVFFYYANMRLVGYAVQAGRLIPIPKFLNAKKTKQAANGSFLVQDASAFTPLDKVKKNSKYISYIHRIKGTNVVQKGIGIGKVCDALYKSEFGEIAYFEVSDGFCEDLLNGRKQISVNKADFFGNNNSIKAKEIEF